MYGAVITQDPKTKLRYIYYFFHFYNGRRLSDLIELKKEISEKLAAQIIKQMLDGLIVMHGNKFIHRDLKPDNVCLHFDFMPNDEVVNKKFIKNWDENVHNGFSVVIVDTGLSKQIDGLKMTPGQGTPLYRAPEVREDDYDYKSDIGSLGIIAYELLTGLPLFTVEDAQGSLEVLLQLWEDTEEYSTRGQKLSYESMQFLQYGLQKDPQNRLPADELYELDFIQNAYNDVPYKPLKNKKQKLNLAMHIHFE